MGTKLSIDKSVSELDNILTMNPKFFKKITFENKCPEDIACHLKVNPQNEILALEVYRRS